MKPILRSIVLAAVVAGVYCCSTVHAQNADEVFLNGSNISVVLGFHNGDTEPFANRSTVDSLESLIDAPTADASELHSQSTHVWVSGGQLELVFDFGADYDLTEFHFWNYTSESFDVDNIDLVFLDSEMNSVGTLMDISPAVAVSPIFAEDTPLQFQDVRFVRATLTGTNDQVDFNNMGFTGFASAPEPVVVLGDINLDGVVSFLDISPFITILFNSGFQAEADIDQNGVVNFLDVAPFVEILSSN